MRRRVAFEVAVIDRIEANERREQPPIGFGELPPDQIALPRQALFELSSVANTARGGFFVGAWRRGEAGAIDAVIDGRVDAIVDAIDLGAQFRRIIIGADIGERVERRIEHADDFGAIHC